MFCLQLQCNHVSRHSHSLFNDLYYSTILRVFRVQYFVDPKNLEPFCVSIQKPLNTSVNYIDSSLLLWLFIFLVFNFLLHLHKILSLHSMYCTSFYLFICLALSLCLSQFFRLSTPPLFSLSGWLVECDALCGGVACGKAALPNQTT